jgi:hypothetical protein
MHFDIGKSSIFEWLLAALFTVMTFALLIGTFVIFFMVVFGNLRDRWPYYDNSKKRKIVINFAVWGSVFIACIFVSMIKLSPVGA